MNGRNAERLGTIEPERINTLERIVERSTVSKCKNYSDLSIRDRRVTIPWQIFFKELLFLMQF